MKKYRIKIADNLGESLDAEGRLPGPNMPEELQRSQGDGKRGSHWGVSQVPARQECIDWQVLRRTWDCSRRVQGVDVDNFYVKGEVRGRRNRGIDGHRGTRAGDNFILPPQVQFSQNWEE
jgi:hypothetical protein